MHCFIKYIHYDDFLESSASENVLQFDNKQLVINPDCFLAIILEYVYGIIGVPRDIRESSTFASDRGKILSVNNLPPETNGQEVFSGKNTYYVVFSENDQFSPMLSPTSREFEEFIALRKRRSSQQKRRSVVSKSSRGSSSISNDSKPRKHNSSSFIQKEIK